jgi:prevent-host-death family protein
MKQVSIQDLKASLSTVVAEAEAGETIVITRHNQPVAQLSPRRHPQVHRGSRLGADRLRPALKRRGGRRSLAALRDDRGGA